MSMVGFWFGAGAITVAVLALNVLALLRARAEDTDSAHDREMRVYRDQLEEIERDLARGVIGENEAARLRTEVSRRLLDADTARARARGRGPAPRTMRMAGLVLVLAVLPLTLLTYWQVGAPGYADLPLAQRLEQAAELRAARPDQAALEARMAERRPAAQDDADRAEHAALVAQLRSALQDRPQDLQGHQLLAHNEAMLGNFREAADAQTRVIEIRGAQAGADDHAVLAEYLILAAGGAVSPEAEAVLEQVLRRDPQNGVALYYTGLLFAQTGREDRTFAVWRRLHDMSPGDAPWMDELRASLPELAEIAGVRYQLPPRPPARAAMAEQGPGPTREDIEAAEDLSEEERTEMVEGMVARLMNRLATEGGAPEDWARLIAALGVLGDTERAEAIWEEAQVVFGAEPEALAPVRAAAENAGLLR